MGTANIKPRIVLYGIGNYGQMMARFADKKGWPIVAAYNRAGAKVGQDIGRLAGLNRDYGVVVQDCDTADYSQLAKLDADIGVVTMYDMLKDNFPAYKRLMGAGLNVICHGSESYLPGYSNPAVAEEIDHIAKANNVSWVGTGVWDMSRIWSLMTVAGVCDEIKSIHNTSVTNLESFGEKITLGAGVGMTPAEFEEKVNDPNKNEYGNVLYKMIPMLALKSLGYTPMECTYRQVPVVLEKPFYCKLLKRELSAGTCAGLRAYVEATSEEGVVATAQSDSRVLFNEGETEHIMWEVKGNVLSPRIRVERDNGHVMQALSVFNRIKDVIAAPPGRHLMSDLPGPMKHLAIQ
jgi:2,4-diaminopentanoate dehydrogenase